jgi:hypothetical protein
MKRPAASTGEVIDVPTTVTLTPDSAAPLAAAVNALAPVPCTVPLIVAALADDEVDGEVGEPL